MNLAYPPVLTHPLTQALLAVSMDDTATTSTYLNTNTVQGICVYYMTTLKKEDICDEISF